MDQTEKRLHQRLVYAWAVLIMAAILFMPVKLGIEQAWALWTYEPRDGIVTETRVSERAGRFGRTIYAPVVAYEYEVGTGKFTGSRLRPGPYATQRREEAENRTSSYRAGDRVTVYVDPGDAEQSFLERTVSWVPYWGTVFLLVVLAPLYAWMFSRRKRQEVFKHGE